MSVSCHHIDLLKETQIQTKSKLYQRLFNRLIACQPSFSLQNQYSINRKATEQYIYNKYYSYYGAKLNHYMPYLLTMSANDTTNAVLGLCIAEDKPLFIEQYIPQTIEVESLNYHNIKVNRDKLIEVGNLAAIQAGSSQLLLLIVVAFLYRSGYEWATFTGTKSVKKITKKLGFITYQLGEANIDSLGKDYNKQWGNYYDSQPYLFVGDLKKTYLALQQHPLFSLALRYFNKNIDELVTAFKH